MFLCSYNFNNKIILTTKVLKQGYRYHKFHKVFSKCVAKIQVCNVGLKTLLQKITKCYNRVGYNMAVLVHRLRICEILP